MMGTENWIAEQRCRHGLAYHEAGHAVVAHVLGEVVELASIVKRNDVIHGGRQETGGRVEVSRDEGDSPWGDPVIYRAGQVARRIATGVEEYSEIDDREVLEIAMEAVPPAEGVVRQAVRRKGRQAWPGYEDAAAVAEENAERDKERDAWEEKVLAEAERLVRENWRAVEALAEALIQQSELGGGEVRDIVEAALREQ